MARFADTLPERRKFRRLEFNALASIEHNKVKLSGRVKNISTTGLFLETDGQYAINDLINLSIFIVHGTARLSFMLPSTVVRTEADGVGLDSPHLDVHTLLHLEFLLDLNNDNSRRLFEEFYKYITM